MPFVQPNSPLLFLSFCPSFSNQDGIGSLLHLLYWSWKRLHDQKDTSVWEAAVSAPSLSKLKDTNMVTFITIACLDMLKTYIARVYPETGVCLCGLGD